MALPVAVVLGDDEVGIEGFSSAVDGLALGSILYTPAGDGLVLLLFEVERDPRRYLELVERLVGYNRFALERVGGDAASVYDGLLRYEERNVLSGSPLERETFQSNVALFARGSGDCADLVAARCAEPQVVLAGGFPVLEQTSGSPRSNLYHALVQYPDGSIEDPSAHLGMKSSCPYRSPS